MCRGLIRLVAEAEVLVLNCSFRGDPVHLAFADLASVVSNAPATATTILSHIDGPAIVADMPNVRVASDLDRIRL
jgi:hypothetical protein